MSISFNDATKTNPEDVLIVDALNLAFRYKHANKPDFGVDYIRTVRSLASSYKCGQVLILADDGHSSYRRGIYPEYKQNRVDKYKDQTEEEKEAFTAFFVDFKKTIELCTSSFPVFQFKNVEADDLAGYIVKNRAKFGFRKIWMASSDKDWDLLISENVSRFSYVTRKETTVENWNSHYPDISMENYMGLKALMGDSGDNIIGVDGIGPKRGTDLINQHGSIFDLLDSMPLAGKQKFIKALNDSKNTIELNIQLVDILTYCEDAIGQENLRIINDKLIKN